MHTLEPYYNWRGLYCAEEDELSPFYNQEYSEFEFSNKIYDFYIHPQWDNIGSQTLFVKLLFAHYGEGKIHYRRHSCEQWHWDYYLNYFRWTSAV